MKIDLGVGEIIDRWSVLKLKVERIKDTEHKREFAVYDRAIKRIKKKYPKYPWDLLCQIMIKTNNYIWKWEAGTKSAKETLPNPYYIMDEINDPVLKKAGLIHFDIKDFNSIRVNMRDLINLLTNTGFQDIKREHLSE